MARRYDPGYRRRRKGRWSGNRSRRGPLVLIVIVGTLAVASMTGSWFLDRDSSVTAKSQPRLVTNVLSLRRIPETTTADISLANLKTTLKPFVDALPASACLIVKVRGKIVEQINATKAFAPASTEKLLTGLVAIERLGEKTRLHTSVRAASGVQGGLVVGDLFLVGGGDPVLSTNDYAIKKTYQPALVTKLEDLADRVAAAGVKQVTGGIVGDESRYDTVRFLKTWGFKFVIADETGPLSALQLNNGFDSETTVAAEPATFAAERLRDLLTQRGVSFGAAPRTGLAPGNAGEIAGIDSPTIGELVGNMLRNSDNMSAELLNKEIDKASGGKGSIGGGAQQIVAQLAADGLPVTNTKLVDGSGLDQSNRATCDLLVNVLERVGPHGAIGDGLSIAGRNGTLAKSMLSTAAEGRVRAKTGAIPGNIALAGFVDAPAALPATTAPVEFAFILNGGGTYEDRLKIRDSLGELLASYPTGPDSKLVTPLVPAPVTTPGGPTVTVKPGTQTTATTVKT